MAAEIIKILSKGLIRDQKTVTKSDTAGQDGALFDADGSINPNIKEAANAIMVSTDGNVTVLLAKNDAAGVPVEDVLPNLIAGVWHNSAPFRQVKDTGTDPATVKVGITSWEYNPGS